MRKPDFIPNHAPTLDGLRGLAIAAVLLFHCAPRLVRLHLAAPARWGWTGVNLFFVLSGFLITGILLDQRAQPGYFRNFYARRVLRIWPVFLLLLLANFVLFPLLWSGPRYTAQLAVAVPWWRYLFMIQNFWHGLTGVMYPTWSLAIEEQFYLIWAPVVGLGLAWSARRHGRFLSLLLAALLLLSPFARMGMMGHLAPTHTLLHLDGLVVGSALALALRALAWTQSQWRLVAALGLATGLAAIVYANVHGGPWFDTLLAFGFGGLLLAALLVESRPHHPYRRALVWPPLRYLGTISYGLYLTHMLVWSQIGAFDHAMDRYAAWGDLAIVAVRLVAAIAVASALWYAFERPILRLKRRFASPPSAPSTARPARTPA